MSPEDEAGPAVLLERVGKSFTAGGRTVTALDGISARVERGSVTGLIGPDGAGKTTLMRLIAGLLRLDRGRIEVLGLDVGTQPLEVQAALGYMPQHFGLYEDLTVSENLDLYADLQGVAATARPARYRELLHMTGLGPFIGRLAGRLSGGMKQKLGLACTLVRAPTLLLLDEPTVGVDPVSRRELWAIVDTLVRAEGMTVLLSTAYLDEAERCDAVLLMHDGRLIGEGAPEEFTGMMAGHSFRVAAAGIGKRRLQERLAGTPGVLDAVIQGGACPRRQRRKDAAARLPPSDRASKMRRSRPTPPRFEDSFVALLKARRGFARRPPARPPAGIGTNLGRASRRRDRRRTSDPPLRHFLRRQRRQFRRPQGRSFRPARRQRRRQVDDLPHALRPVAGERRDAACRRLRPAPGRGGGARAYRLHGAEILALWQSLGARKSALLFSSAYGLYGARQRQRIDWAIEEFELHAFAAATSQDLPLGYKQRLALACALMHEPDILFLDEPTSGVDPLARREFWRRINSARRIRASRSSSPPISWKRRNIAIAS